MKFVLVVEDDALPMSESLSVISRLVTGHWTSRQDSLTAGERFYVKLYHPVHLQGYAISFSCNFKCQFFFNSPSLDKMHPLEADTMWS